MKISRDFAEKMALLPLKNERIAIKSLEILAPLFKSSNVTDIYILHSFQMGFLSVSRERDLVRRL